MKVKHVPNDGRPAVNQPDHFMIPQEIPPVPANLASVIHLGTISKRGSTLTIQFDNGEDAERALNLLTDIDECLPAASRSLEGGEAIRLDGPMPSEPGWYFVDIRASGQVDFAIVDMDGKCPMIRCDNGCRLVMGNNTKARWSRKLSIE